MVTNQILNVFSSIKKVFYLNAPVPKDGGSGDDGPASKKLFWQMEVTIPMWLLPKKKCVAAVPPPQCAGISFEKSAEFFVKSISRKFS